MSKILKKIQASLNPQATALLFYDEFALSTRITTCYGWAAKNSRPRIPSHENYWYKTNGLLAVNALTGKEYLAFSEVAKACDIAEYIVSLAVDLAKEDTTKLILVLDNNSTHKKKMKAILATKLLERTELGCFSIEFVHTPAYSPDYNLVEYIIHQLRLRLIHHKPLNETLAETMSRIEQHLSQNQLQTAEQVQKTLDRICQLPYATN